MTAAHDTNELQPCGRYEWERLIRRAVLPRPVKFTALVLATYADPDGSRVRPGLDVLAAVTGYSDRNVRRIMTTLTDQLGLLRLVIRGGGRGRAGRSSVYRLTIPVDLLERVELLPPREHPEPPIDRTSETPHSSPPDVRPDTQGSGQTDLVPVDNPEPPDTQMSPQSPTEPPIDRTSNTVTKQLTGHFDPIDRTSRCPPTTHRDQPQQTTQVPDTQRNSRPRARPRPKKPP